MANCPICSASNPDGAIACLSCGSSLVSSSGGGSHTLRSGAMLGGGRFTVGKVLGQGGFGITYLGSNVENRQAVAIKEFFLQGCVRQGTAVGLTGAVSKENFETIKKKFLDESRILAQFQHPGIVRVWEAFEENGTAYMVMEYLKGQTLQGILEKRKSLPEAEAIGCIVKVAEALEAIHGANILHRDIKPDNIIVTEDGRVVLIDFGSARQFAAGKTKMMTSWLTPGYAPVEQYGQKAQFSATTDMYSLGATLYHLLTGHMPEQATDRVAEDSLKPPCKLNHKVSQKTSDAVMWAMQMDPKARPQLARDFIKVLVSETPVTIPVTAPVISAPTVRAPSIESVEQPKTESSGKRNILAILLVIFSVVMIGGLAVVNVWENSVGSKTFHAMQITLKNPNPDFKYVLSTSECDIAITAIRHEIPGISDRQLNPYVELSSLGPGTHNVPVSVDYSGSQGQINDAKANPPTAKLTVVAVNMEKAFQGIPIEIRGASSNLVYTLDPEQCAVTANVEGDHQRAHSGSDQGLH